MYREIKEKQKLQKNRKNYKRILKHIQKSIIYTKKIILQRYTSTEYISTLKWELEEIRNSIYNTIKRIKDQRERCKIATLG